MWFNNPTLECQDCGKVLRRLTDAEAQRVAERPYDYVMYCWPCQLERNRNVG